jgi:hypothetical protein
MMFVCDAATTHIDAALTKGTLVGLSTTKRVPCSPDQDWLMLIFLLATDTTEFASKFAIVIREDEEIHLG